MLAHCHPFHGESPPPHFVPLASVDGMTTAANGPLAGLLLRADVKLQYCSLPVMMTEVSAPGMQNVLRTGVE